MHEKIRRVLLRRGNLLDKKYILNWLSQFASALDKPGIQKRFEGLWKEIVEGSISGEKHHGTKIS